ncbi:hypothetical protein [Pseudalkalibacillus sp. SCS-8]|uniref:hypothetical protein n=1 Tax=Pseudalkalibacillus nanhaiensis TaxID=3115291 RepID=UPI0032DBC216
MDLKGKSFAYLMIFVITYAIVTVTIGEFYIANQINNGLIIGLLFMIFLKLDYIIHK